MMLFGSAARKVDKGQSYDAMVAEAINKVKETKKGIGIEKAISFRKTNAIMERIIDIEGIDEYTARKLGLMYNNLAPDDLYQPISVKMMLQFLENVVKKQNPEAYEKIWRYYDYNNPLPDKLLKKMAIFVENVWNRYRKVEYCYLYSKGFHDFVDKYASKVDAKGLNNIEKIKWLRLWVFVIKDQGFFWKDINPNGTITVSEQVEFNRKVYLFPDTMLYLEPYVNRLEEKDLNVEMLKRFIGMYPENVQKQIYSWGEMDDSDTINMLRAGEVRMGIKRTLFPITWMSPMNLFCLNSGMKYNKPEYIKSAVEVYKKGNMEALSRIDQKGTDPFDLFKIKNFKSYEIYSVKEENLQKIFVVNSSKELEMFVELYKWLVEHQDFRFGLENKNIVEYGMAHLLEDETKIKGKWLLEMGFVDSEEDINWENFNKILEGKENEMDRYLNGEISPEDIYEIIGFTSDMQAKACCNKKTKLIPTEASKMSAALKRIKMFGEAVASKSDKIYLEIFKYMMSEKPGELPKTMVNLYGMVFN